MAKIKFSNPYPPIKNDIGGNPKPTDAPVAPVETTVEKSPSLSFKGLIKEKPKYKSYGFYLTDEVVEALDNLAKQHKSNKSKILEMILREVLLGE